MTVAFREPEVLRISVRPSPRTTDFEVCLAGDGRDLVSRFDPRMMGLDPRDILAQPCPLLVDGMLGEAMIGRCDCGFTPCGSVSVVIRRRPGTIVWTTDPRTIEVVFDATQYTAEVNRALRDVSWESPGRKAARLIGLGVDREALLERDLRFRGASARAPDWICLALDYTPGDYRLLVSLPWPDGGISAAVGRALEVVRSDPSTWERVAWSAGDGVVRPPAIAGPVWTQLFAEES